MTPAAELASLLEAARAALAGLPAEATADPTQVAQTLAAQGTAVLISAPRRTWPTWTSEDREWSVWIVAPYDHDPLAGLEALDEALSALAPAEALALDEAEPSVWDAHGRTYPAYTARFTTHH